MNAKVVFICLALVVAAAQAGGSSRFVNRLNSDDGGLGMYNGKSTTIEKHPYVASLLFHGLLSCGATIISRSWVLVSGDCVFGVVDPTLVTIVSGSNDGVTGTTHPVQQIVTHPIYQHEVLDYNIALVKISDSFKWNKKTRPIKLPNKEIAANTQTMVAGYGWTKPNTEATTGYKLRQGQMKWLSKAKCASMLPDTEFSDLLACAYNKGKTTLCDRDWGDALVKNGFVYGLFVGAVDEGFCTSEASPNIFTDVYPFTSWIRNTTGITY